MRYLTREKEKKDQRERERDRENMRGSPFLKFDAKLSSRTS